MEIYVSTQVIGKDGDKRVKLKPSENPHTVSDGFGKSLIEQKLATKAPAPKKAEGATVEETKPEKSAKDDGKK